MALTELQKAVLHVIAANRTETSYLAGGAVLNHDWPRSSDDFDVFHDTDEEIGASADRDLTSLKNAGFRCNIDIRIYGLVEATISRDGSSTILQWMSESRRRFFPLVRDVEWGVRLHQAYLAINKLIAASSRSKARDLVDLLAIETYYCRLASLALAAAGKPPHFSPQRTLDEVLRRITGMPDEEFQAIRGIPPAWSPNFIRTRLKDALHQAERQTAMAVEEAVGCLVVDSTQTPVILQKGASGAGVSFRRATEEPDAMPQIKDSAVSFLPD